MASVDPPMANNNATQGNSIEFFTKWSILPTELRNHAMAYFKGATMFNYGQCSKLCNKEVQKFELVPRLMRVECLNKKSKEIMIHVTMSNRMGQQRYKFKDFKYRKNQKYVVRTWSSWNPLGNNGNPKNSTFDGRAIEGVIGFLEQTYRNKRQRFNTSIIDLKFQVWPVELTDFFQNSKSWKFPIEMFEWHIYMNSSVYDGFMEAMKDGPENMKLDMKCHEGGSYLWDKFSLPPEFYQSKLFKCIDSFKSNANNMSNDDLLESTASDLTIRNSNITNAGINKMLKKWYNGTTASYKHYIITQIPEDLNTELLFEGLPARQRDEQNWYINRPNGFARVRVHDYMVMFDSRFCFK